MLRKKNIYIYPKIVLVCMKVLYAKIYSVKKICIVYFFLSDLKMVSYEKSESVQSSVFQKCSIGRFLLPIFKSLLKKYTKHSFSTN